ncbi:MAG: ADP-ribosylglycohydrolase family protein [Armatimonadetes bacterium]|nr:ADP-ribosylglycohydrolase family protein [Armatimonadota bacterium]
MLGQLARVGFIHRHSAELAIGEVIEEYLDNLPDDEAEKAEQRLRSPHAMAEVFAESVDLVREECLLLEPKKRRSLNRRQPAFFEAMRDKYVGCMVGLAVGDALGFPVEFWDERTLAAEPVEDFRAFRKFPPGTFSDDTQMSIALAKALLRAGDRPLEELMQVVAEEFVAWASSPENNRAPGEACLRGCEKLARGVHWSRSGCEGSKGCGAGMRSAPVGLYYYGDEERLVEVARAQAICTHRHPTAEAGGLGTAYAVALALEGVAPHEFPRRIAEVTAEISAEFADCIMRAEAVVDKPQRQAFRAISGGERIGWVAEEAVAAALWCFLQAPEDFARAVLLAANSPLDADRDSIACIAGAIAGAYLGEAAIPEKWRSRVEKADELVALGERLLAAARARRR